MLFNSFGFFIFFFVTTLLFFILPRKLQWLWLLIASSYFYFCFSPVYLALFFSLILINYCFGSWIQKAKIDGQKYVFVLAVVINILVLCFFKYSRAIDSLVNADAGTDKSIFSGIILPLGLSYFVFSILAYLIEVKRGNIMAERHLGVFASAYMFFPKIAQGPIERPNTLLPQFHQDHDFDIERILDGFKLILWGLFKKLVIADRLGLYVNAVFNNYEHHSGTTLCLATLFYSFQIYADFSGYTDIALGSAHVLGFKLTNNFKRPYFAQSVKEFWDRWHISFSTWLRDYLFLPVAYSLAHKMKKEKYLFIPSDRLIYMISIVLTFAVCGIWHGEGTNYILWGLIFGVSLTYINWTSKLNKRLKKFLKVKKIPVTLALFKTATTFILISFAWIFFRADDSSAAFRIVAKIFSEPGKVFIDQPSNIIFSLFGILFLIAVELYQERVTRSNLPYVNKSWFKEQLAYIFLIIIILMIGVFDSGQFIYFQF